MLAEGLTCAIERLPHGHHGRGGREPVRHLARARRTRSRPRASGAPVAAIDAGWFATRSCRSRMPQKKGDPIAFDTRRVSARRHDRREAGRPEAGVPERRDGDGGQRLRHQRRRRGAGRRRARRDASHEASRRWRESSSYATAGVEPRSWASGPVPAVRKALERAGLDGRRHRSVRAERGVRRAVARGRAASWSSIPRG